jgi:hypothetical protein
VAPVSVEIQAALIGGALSGAVVLVGVLLAEYLVRRRQREDQLKAAVQRLALTAAKALIYAGPTPPSPDRLSFGSAGWVAFNETYQVLYEIELLSRRGVSTHAKQVREQANDLNAKLFAVSSRLQRGIVLTEEELWSLTGDCGQLSVTVFGPSPYLEELFRRYDEQGFGGSVPGPPPRQPQ